MPVAPPIGEPLSLHCFAVIEVPSVVFSVKVDEAPEQKVVLPEMVPVGFPIFTYIALDVTGPHAAVVIRQL